MRRDAKYLAHYVELLRKQEYRDFQANYRSAMLVGTGLAGDIASRRGTNKRRTLGTSGDPELEAVRAITGRVWPIRRDPGSPRGSLITIGQSIDCDITIPEYTLSTRHCSFTFDRAHPQVIDLNSLNGTQVNGVVLDSEEPHELNDGDTLSLGRLRLDFHSRRGFFERIFKLLFGEQAQVPPLMQQRLDEQPPNDDERGTRNSKPSLR